MTRFEEIEIIDVKKDNSALFAQKDAKGLSSVTNRYVDQRGNPSKTITDLLEITFDRKDIVFPNPPKKQLNRGQILDAIVSEYKLNNNVQEI